MWTCRHISFDFFLNIFFFCVYGKLIFSTNCIASPGGKDIRDKIDLSNKPGQNNWPFIWKKMEMIPYLTPYTRNLYQMD